VRYGKSLSLVIAVIAIPLMNLLSGCGGCNSPMTASTSNSIVGRWTGTITRAAQSLSLTIDFTQNGSQINGVGEIALIDEPTFGVAPGDHAFLLGSSTFGVNVNGNSATFTANFEQTSSTNVSALAAPGNAPPILIVVPGESLDPMSFRLNIGTNTLTGSYSITGANAHTGAVSLTKGGAPPTIDGHWTGSMSSTLGQEGVTMDLFLAANPSNPNLVNNVGGKTTTIASNETTNTWTDPVGIDTVLIGNEFFANINFVIFDPAASTDRVFPHRYLFGTVSGNTISGGYIDAFTADGMPNDSGTFVLTKQAQ